MPRWNLLKLVLLNSSLLVLVGCSISPPYVPETHPLDQGRLPEPDVSVKIPQLSSCTDSPDTTVQFNAEQPVTVLVHGCKGSAGRFRSLAQLFAFHGQQAVCFSYDDRASLRLAAKQLNKAVDELSLHLANPKITVIGHSMGGLVARKSMEDKHSVDWQRKDIDLKLTTISAPVGGIDVASPCGNKLLHWVSLGTIPGICWIITGNNWYEITPASDFIQKPGPLLQEVNRYLKVVTNEQGTCRRLGQNGTCLESDHIFDVFEQYHPVVDEYPKLTNIEVKAGHVEIVGNKHMVPRKLLSILQEQNILSQTPPERMAALERLLFQLYGD